MQYNEIKEMSTEKLNKLLKTMQYNLIRAKSEWSKNLIKNKEAGIGKSTAKQGDKTSLRKNIRRNIAKIKTELRFRELEDECS